MADITEEEQIEALKRWWAKNGTSTLVGIVLALAVVFGYQAWRNHQQQRGEAASRLYEQLLTALDVDSPLKTVDKEHISTAKFLARQLEDGYSGSAYAHFAALYLAKLAVDEGDLKTAAQELNWALSHGLDDSLVTIVKIRLARVQLAQGKPDDALRTLDGVQPGDYRPTYDELKGDIYHSMGDNEKAREAYERAVNALGAGETRPMLQMKLDELEPPAAVIPEKSGQGKGTTTGAGADSGATKQQPTGNGTK